VRKGKEIKANQIEFYVTEVGSSRKIASEHPLNDFIRREILRNTEKNFLSPDAEVEFYKLAIYEPGGHFQTHRDTVHSADHKATFLLEVRSEHTGGALNLIKNGTTVEWDLSMPAVERSDEKEQSPEDEFIIEIPEQKNETEKASKRAREENFPLKWILFYTDIAHSIAPVTSGIRMVLQFNVYDRSVKALEMEKNQKSGQDENEDEGGDQEESEEAVSEEEENEEDDDDDYDDGGIFEYSKFFWVLIPRKGPFLKLFRS
jgi:hypothetical protein